jgi:hypothetical protein
MEAGAEVLEWTPSSEEILERDPSPEWQSSH